MVIGFGHIHTFFMRNSFTRNLYWDRKIAEKLSVLKLQRLRNFRLFFVFSIIILKTQQLILIKTCSEKNYFVVQTLTVKDVLGCQFLTMTAAETFCIVCLPPEQHIS